MTNSAKGLIIASIGVLIMSLESLFIKLATVSALTFSFYLGIFMFFSMTLTMFIKQRDEIKSITKNSFPILLFAAFLMGSSNIFFITAIKNTTVANVVIIFGTSALFASFFAYFLYKEKIEKNILIASFFMIIGLFIIFSDNLGLGNLLGNMYALFCTISFSLTFVFLSKYKKISRMALIAIAGICISTISLILSDSLVINLNNLLIIAFMGLLITPFARVLMGNGTKYISSAEVALLMIIETLMAPIWVWIFLNEIPNSNTFLGGSIIMSTLILNSLYTLKKGNIK